MSATVQMRGDRQGVGWALMLGTVLYGAWAVIMIFTPARGHAMMSAPNPFNPGATRMFGAALVGTAGLMWAARSMGGLRMTAAVGSGAISLLAVVNLITGDFTRGLAMLASTALSVVVTLALWFPKR